MAEQATSHEHADADAHGRPIDYIRVWTILLVLLVVSILGPMLGIPWLTLFTAFGIAVVKAYLVAKKFMHLDLEPRYVVYLLVTCVAFMGLFFTGTAVDVMRHDGHHWENVAAKKEVRRVLGEGAASEAAPHPTPSPAAAAK